MNAIRGFAVAQNNYTSLMPAGVISIQDSDVYPTLKSSSDIHAGFTSASPYLIDSAEWSTGNSPLLHGWVRDFNGPGSPAPTIIKFEICKGAIGSGLTASAGDTVRLYPITEQFAYDWQRWSIRDVTTDTILYSQLVYKGDNDTRTSWYDVEGTERAFSSAPDTATMAYVDVVVGGPALTLELALPTSFTNATYFSAMLYEVLGSSPTGPSFFQRYIATHVSQTA